MSSESDLNPAAVADRRYADAAQRELDHFDRRYGPNGSRPDPQRWTDQARAELYDAVLADATLVGEIARRLNLIDGLSAHTGAGESPGMRACYVNRDGDPEDDGFREHGVKREHLVLAESDGLGYRWIHTDLDPEWPVAEGMLVVHGEPVTALRFRDDADVRTQVHQQVAELGEGFLTRNRAVLDRLARGQVATRPDR